MEGVQLENTTLRTIIRLMEIAEAKSEEIIKAQDERIEKLEAELADKHHNRNSLILEFIRLADEYKSRWFKESKSGQNTLYITEYAQKFNDLTDDLFDLGLQQPYPRPIEGSSGNPFGNYYTPEQVYVGDFKFGDQV